MAISDTEGEVKSDIVSNSHAADALDLALCSVEQLI